MAGTVIDEIVVKLTLDAKDYETSDKKVDGIVSKTEKKREQAGVKTKKRDEDALKRTKATTSALKTLAVAVGSVAAVGAVVFAAGTAIFGAASQFANMEANLKRTAVSTNLSNREMQAWGATAKRIGVDANAGAAAIADLAKEQQQFKITGNAPTLAAFSRMGIQANPETPLVDILGEAQKTYKASSPAQQQNIEAGLSAQGVSADLIVMIKSETDVRATYLKSLTQAQQEDEKSLAAVRDAMASATAALAAFSNAVTIAAKPAFDLFAEWIGAGAKSLSVFNDRVIASGGGLDGFTRVLTTDFPTSMSALTNYFRFLGEEVDIAAWGFTKIYKAGENLVSWLNRFSSIRAAGGVIKEAAGDVVDWAAKQWKQGVAIARAEGPAPVANWNKSNAAPPPAPIAANAQALMTKLVTGYGMNVPQAAATVANMQAESGLNPTAYNTEGGGNGARGLMQLRGPRIQNFQKMFGKLPNEATVDQQLEFMMKDPYERNLLNKTFAPGGNAEQQGTAFSRVVEAHGNVKADAQRGVEAAKLANSYQGSVANAGSAVFTIGTLNVSANNPTELVGQVQRYTGTQNFNSGIR